MQGQLSVRIMRRLVETDFDEEEFLVRRCCSLTCIDMHIDIEVARCWPCSGSYSSSVQSAVAPQESAKDAYYIVNDLFAGQDFDTLSPMVSEKLLDAFR